jgi:DNA polymerase III epsilon subunit-like protein
MTGQAWQDAYDMPEPPLNDKGRPRWPHAHQQKVAYIDTEFLSFRVDHLLLTEVSVWLEEEAAPQSWRIQPRPDLLDFIERHDPKMWGQIQRAAKVNGFNREEWSDAPLWIDVRDEIARCVFGRVLVGVNVYAADIKRLADGFYPRDEQWLMPCNAIDVQTLARMAGHKKTSLDALCKAYGIEEETVHHAEGGVRRVRAVCEAMLGGRDGDS